MTAIGVSPWYTVMTWSINVGRVAASSTQVNVMMREFESYAATTLEGVPGVTRGGAVVVVVERGIVVVGADVVVGDGTVVVAPGAVVVGLTVVVGAAVVVGATVVVVAIVVVGAVVVGAAVVVVVTGAAIDA